MKEIYVAVGNERVTIGSRMYRMTSASKRRLLALRGLKALRLHIPGRVSGRYVYKRREG